MGKKKIAWNCLKSRNTPFLFISFIPEAPEFPNNFTNHLLARGPAHSRARSWKDKSVHFPATAGTHPLASFLWLYTLEWCYCSQPSPRTLLGGAGICRCFIYKWQGYCITRMCIWEQGELVCKAHSIVLIAEAPSHGRAEHQGNVAAAPEPAPSFLRCD